MSAASAPTLHQETATARQAMVDSQLRTNDINDPRLVSAIAATPRELHVPVAQRSAAYIDRSLPLGAGRALNPALTTARLISELGDVAGKSVLLIGAATGYSASILAKLGAAVTAVEEAVDLLAIAREAVGTTAIDFVEGPLALGAADRGPFDALIVDGAVEQLPSDLLGQLNDGAVIVTGIIDQGVTRLGRATYVAGVRAVNPLPYIDLECVRLPGFAPPPRFTF